MKKILLVLGLGFGIAIGGFALPNTTQAAAVWAAQYSDGTIYYDDSSIYWQDGSHFSVIASQIYPSGRTEYITIKYVAGNDGIWYCRLDNSTYRPVTSVPMAQAIFNQIHG